MGSVTSILDLAARSLDLLVKGEKGGKRWNSDLPLDEASGRIPVTARSRRVLWGLW